MSLVIEDVLVRADPAQEPSPLVFDSPHSGSIYPPDFLYSCPLPLLRQAEDAYVDELFAFVPDLGATFLSALFPRSYIDLNRAPDDIDPEVLADPWPYPLYPTEKSAMGMGLIRRLCKPGVPLYDGRLSVAQVAERIERYYRPYHAQLGGVIDALHNRFGFVWHINCHSMPTVAIPARGGTLQRPDFVLGDRHGTTCGPHLTAFVKSVLEELGYTVWINDPYQGVELIRRYSNPAQGRHSLQIEISRHLYMNEETLEKHDGFDVLIDRLSSLVARLSAQIGKMNVTRAAE